MSQRTGVRPCLIENIDSAFLLQVARSVATKSPRRLIIAIVVYECTHDEHDGIVWEHMDYYTIFISP
jgi:hypothetical protein